MSEYSYSQYQSYGGYSAGGGAGAGGRGQSARGGLNGSVTGNRTSSSNNESPSIDRRAAFTGNDSTSISGKDAKDKAKKTAKIAKKKVKKLGGSIRNMSVRGVDFIKEAAVTNDDSSHDGGDVGGGGRRSRSVSRDVDRNGKPRSRRGGSLTRGSSLTRVFQRSKDKFSEDNDRASQEIQRRLEAKRERARKQQQQLGGKAENVFGEEDDGVDLSAAFSRKKGAGGGASNTTDLFAQARTPNRNNTTSNRKNSSDPYSSRTPGQSLTDRYKQNNEEFEQLNQSLFAKDSLAHHAPTPATTTPSPQPAPPRSGNGSDSDSNSIGSMSASPTDTAAQQTDLFQRKQQVGQSARFRGAGQSARYVQSARAASSNVNKKTGIGKPIIQSSSSESDSDSSSSFEVRKSKPKSKTPPPEPRQRPSLSQSKSSKSKKFQYGKSARNLSSNTSDTKSASSSQQHKGRKKNEPLKDYWARKDREAAERATQMEKQNLEVAKMWSQLEESDDEQQQQQQQQQQQDKVENRDSIISHTTKLMQAMDELEHGNVAPTIPKHLESQDENENLRGHTSAFKARSVRNEWKQEQLSNSHPLDSENLHKNAINSNDLPSAWGGEERSRKSSTSSSRKIGKMSRDRSEISNTLIERSKASRGGSKTSSSRRRKKERKEKEEEEEQHDPLTPVKERPTIPDMLLDAPPPLPSNDDDDDEKEEVKQKEDIRPLVVPPATRNMNKSYPKKTSGPLSTVSSLSGSDTESEEDDDDDDYDEGKYSRSLRDANRLRSNRDNGGDRRAAAIAKKKKQLPPISGPINLHTDLEESSWLTLHHHLEYLSSHSDLILPTLTNTDPKDQSTPLHTAVWKAPPSLALMLIRLLPTSKELSGIFMSKDRDSNTALHLSCGNLDLVQDPAAALEAAKEGCKSSVAAGINTTVLEALVRVAPRALQMQNVEGDTPLHMLVCSPACCFRQSSSAAVSHHPESGNDAAAIATAAQRIVAILLDTCPDAALMQDTTGATPLHAAIANNAHDKVLMRLLDAAPMACRVEDNRNMLPLHYVAAFHKTSYTVVKKMIECHPESITHHTVNGDTPLHLAVSNAAAAAEDGGGSVTGKEDVSSPGESGKLDRNRSKVVELLMGQGRKDRRGSTDSPSQHCPLLMTNREKLTPLHCCALFDAPPALTRLLMTHPLANKAAAMTNSFGATPLHLATAQPGVAQSIATVVALGTPEAAAVQDRLKRTPLHVASQNIHSSNVLIKTLADLNPEATAIKTQRGHLPIHLAAQSQAKEPVIKALIKAFPQATEARNKSSNTPLHDAAKYRASAGAVKLLLDTYPDAVYIQNQYGNLPLHCATAYQAPGGVVQMLLKAWPDGASMQNRNQDAPLHYAAAYATTVDAVKPLIDAAPAAVLLLNSSSQSPIDRAKANNAPQEIIELLEASADGWTKKAASDGFGNF